MQFQGIPTFYAPCSQDRFRIHHHPDQERMNLTCFCTYWSHNHVCNAHDFSIRCVRTERPSTCLFDIKWSSLEGEKKHLFIVDKSHAGRSVIFLAFWLFVECRTTMDKKRQASGTASVNSSSLATLTAKQIRKQWHTREQ